MILSLELTFEIVVTGSVFLISWTDVYRVDAMNQAVPVLRTSHRICITCLEQASVNIAVLL